MTKKLIPEFSLPVVMYGNEFGHLVVYHFWIARWNFSMSSKFLLFGAVLKGHHKELRS